MDRNSCDSLGELSRLLVEGRDPALAERFLRELLTPSEVEGISSRWELVKRLRAGESQRHIAQALGISLCKITRGSRELKRTGSALRAVLDLLDTPAGPSFPPALPSGPGLPGPDSPTRPQRPQEPPCPRA